MPDEKLQEKAVEKVIDLLQELNAEILEKVGESINKIGKVTPSKAHQLVQQLMYGEDYNKIVKKLTKVTGLGKKEIEKIFKDTAKKNQLFSKQFYDARNIEFIPYNKNKVLQKQVETFSRATQKMYEKLANSGFYIIDNKNVPIKNVYNHILEKSLMSITTGQTSYQEEMRRITSEMALKGIRTRLVEGKDTGTFIVDYASGRTRRLDSVLRMHLLGSMRDMSNELQKDFGKEFGADGIEISVHINPAPDHEEAQGHQFKIIEYEKLNNGETATDYNDKQITLDHDENGSYRPISTLNCRHYEWEIVLGVSKPRYTQEQLNEIIRQNKEGFTYKSKHYTNYEGTQLQRQLETKIRQNKDQQIVARASGDLSEVDKCQRNIKSLTNEYNEVSKISGLPTSKQRTSVSGFKKIKISNVISKNKLDSNEIFISKEAQQRRINYRKEYINEQLLKNKEGLSRIPEDSTRSWDVSRRKIYESDINKYNKQLKELTEITIEDKTIKLNTIDDCKDLLKEININLKDKNIEKIDNDIIIATSKKYYSLAEKYPFLDQSLQEKHININFENLEGGVIGNAERGGQNIGLDIDDFTDKKETIFWAENQTRKHFNMPCSKNDYINYFQTHEMGHIFDYRVIDNVDISELEDLSTREFTKKTNEYFINNILDIASKETNKTRDQLLELLSDYAKTNEDETMAELFANANCGKPNELGKAFDKYFKELLK